MGKNSAIAEQFRGPAAFARMTPVFLEMDKNSGRADLRSAVARVGGIRKNDTDILEVRELMELKYESTYRAKGLKRYSVGEIQGLNTAAMELAEPRLRTSEGKLEPGEICMLIFGITPEEYAWRGDAPKKLDALADQLRKRVPADRLIAWRVVDLKGQPVQRELKPRTGESIDGGAYAQAMKGRVAPAGGAAGPLDAEVLECHRLQKLCAAKEVPEGVRADWDAAKARLGAGIAALEAAWAAYDAPMGGRFPAIGYDGRIEIFTLRERAEAAQSRIAGADGLWQLRELPKEELRALLDWCAENGIAALRVDNGFAPAELSLKDVREVPDCENAKLRALMLREAQYGLRWNHFKQAQAEERLQRGALESMLTLRSFAWHELGNALLYAVCANPGGGSGDLATAAAAAKLGGARVVPGDRCVLLTEKQSGASRLAAFTSKKRALVLAGKLKGGARPVAMTFDDLAQRAGSCEGLLIDPDDLGYRLPKQEFDRLLKLRGKPPVAVRVKAAEDLPATEVPAPQLRAEMGDLPDPDRFDAPRGREAPPAEPSPETSAEKKPKRLGFWDRVRKK